MKKVMSYALFRHLASYYETNRDVRGTFFYQYLPVLVRTHHELFPDWELRIHHDENIVSGYYGGVLFNLEEKGFLKLVYMGKAKTLCGSMLWRLAPLFDPEVGYVACRDLDSLSTSRERKMLDEFTSSGKGIHAIHDHPAHEGPLMGGMVAFSAGKFRQRFCEIKDFDGLSRVGSTLGLSYNVHGDDQIFLNKIVWPKFSEDFLIHTVKDEKLNGFRPVIPISNSDEDKFSTGIGVPYTPTPVIKYFDQKGLTSSTVLEAESWGVHQIRLKKLAVLSSDVGPYYSFFAPLTCAFWQRIGYHPLLICSSSYEEWMAHPRRALVIKETAKIGASVKFVPIPERHKPTDGPFTASLRMLACMYDYSEDTYLMTGDVDMWVLDGQRFNKQDFKKIAVFNVDVENFRWFAMCYIGAPLMKWREFMGVGEGDVGAKLTELFDERDDLKTWKTTEEQYISEKIMKSSFYPGECDLIEIDWSRNPPGTAGRIDRGGWPAQVDIRGKIDSHLPRPGYDHWKDIRPIIEQAMPEKLSWADGYYEKFRSLL
jgi:hypothetical protein